MKTPIQTAITLILLLSAISTYADVAAQFEVQTGGTSGKGAFHRVPFTWESSAAIAKTMPAAILRVNHFSGNQISFSFESPMDMTSILFLSANPSSRSRITLYDASGTVIPIQKILITSPDGVKDFPSEIVENTVHFAGTKGVSNYQAIIDYLPEVSGVSKVVIDVEHEAGLLDIRLRGTASN